MQEVSVNHHITPSPTLTPEQRIEIYNQQYWYRLLAILHEDFPLLVRLFGYRDFNQIIGVPYLTAYPPKSWSLNKVPTNILKWFDQSYHQNDREIVRLAAEIDLAYHDSFIAKNVPPLQGDPEKLFTKQLKLQPHLHLIHANRDLLPHRQTFLNQEVEYWIDAPFPNISHEETYYAIFRTKNMRIAYKTLSPKEFNCLKSIEQGKNLQEICNQTPSEELPFWIQEWSMRHWLTH